MPTTSTRRKNKVVVQYAVARRGVPSAASLRKWARAASPMDVTLRIVGEREGQSLNQKYRKKNGATNVLSFAHGDIVLCHPVIRREARAQGKSVAAHYAHLVVHGVLHLRGYDHKKKRETSRMACAEIGILRRLNFRNPYELE